VTSVGAIDGAGGLHEGGCAEEVQILQKFNESTASQQLGSTAQLEDSLRNVGAGGTDRQLSKMNDAAWIIDSTRGGRSLKNAAVHILRRSTLEISS
jgi:hypothetical protein